GLCGAATRNRTRDLMITNNMIMIKEDRTGAREIEKTRGFLESNASGTRGLSPFFVGSCAKFVPRILLIRFIVHNRPNSRAIQTAA
ncbi:hypothetical protein, partial [uncultured Sneathiella sp.]|uniref:hypothetical protein n=1 Tax=uncultured Sneathiella sp. TaxID=879315 RepID=UPI0030DC6E2B